MFDNCIMKLISAVTIEVCYISLVLLDHNLSAVSAQIYPW